MNEGAKISYFSAPDPQLFDKVVMAADSGVVYPVSNELTRSVANLEIGPAKPTGAATK